VGGSVGVTEAVERRLMAEGGVRISERLWTLRIALHTERERERREGGGC